MIKKPLLLFLLSLILLIIIAVVYQRYCKSKPNGCKKVERSADESYPQKGIDW